MGRKFELTEDQENIRGIFWAPGHDDEKVSGILQLKAGQNALLETSHFTYGGIQNIFPFAPKAVPGTNQVLRGDEVIKAMFAPSRRILHGHDEDGKALTLIECHSTDSHNTLAMVGHYYSCQQALFGIAAGADDLQFDGLRLHFDHQDEWLNRSAFGKSITKRENAQAPKRITNITIPFSEQSSIPLHLDGYENSQFLLSWSMKPGPREFILKSRSYFELKFTHPRSWNEVLQEIHRWRWFFSLATRTTVDVMQVSLLRKDLRYSIETEPMEEIPLWMPRLYGDQFCHPNRRNRDFHFVFDDVEHKFPEVVKKWKSINEVWGAVLHRFFAVAEPRDLSINEEFLFLAQAVESLHFAKTGITDVSKAAKETYLKSPPGLQALLGKRGTFTTQVYKSRNYWTHYGKPSPVDDPDILDGDALIDLTEKLRWLVEAAILTEIGVPDRCVARVWSEQWKLRDLEYE